MSKIIKPVPNGHEERKFISTSRQMPTKEHTKAVPTSRPERPTTDPRKLLGSNVENGPGRPGGSKDPLPKASATVIEKKATLVSSKNSIPVANKAPLSKTYATLQKPYGEQKKDNRVVEKPKVTTKQPEDKPKLMPKKPVPSSKPHMKPPKQMPSRPMLDDHSKKRPVSRYLDDEDMDDGEEAIRMIRNMFRSKMLLDNSSTSMDDMNDFERQLQELFDQVKSMFVLGNKDDAANLLQANYLAVKEQMDSGAKGIEQAAILDIIGLGYMAAGDFKLVEIILGMLHGMVGYLQNDEPLLDSILMHMGSMYTTLGKFDDAMLVYNRGLEILEGLFGKHSPFLITPLMGIAKVFGLIGRATKAIEIYHRAIGILEMSRGIECEDLVVPLCALGNLFIKEGKVTDAEITFKRILNLYTNIYGASDGRTGMAMCSLAHSMCAKGNVSDAILLYGKGLEVIKDSDYMSLDDDVLEKMRVDFAELLHAAGREREGRDLLEECLLISERYKGKEHPSSVTHLLNLAGSYSRSKNFVEAERLLRTSLQIMSKMVDPEDQSLTTPMLHLAVTLYHLEQDEEAERLALEAVRIRENAFGKQSLPVGEALDCLISIQARMGKDDGELLVLLKRVLSIQEGELGSESEEVIVTLKKIVSKLDKMGRRHEKLPLQRRLSVLRRKYNQSVPV